MAQRAVAVLTGCTSGLGVYVALGLAPQFDLVLLARDAARAALVVARIALAVPACRVDVVLADLSLMRETTQACRHIAATHATIKLLVLNAGTLEARRLLTAEGQERILAINHLSPFLTLQLLGPRVKGRIVVVGSTASDRAVIDPADLAGSRRWGRLHSYGQSKLALMMTSFEWAKRLAPAASVMVVHPGVVATGLVKEGGVVGAVWRLMGMFSMTPEQGAAAPLRACLDPALAGVTGKYLKPACLAAPNRLTRDAALCARVWAATEALCNEAEQKSGSQGSTRGAAVLADP